MTKRIILIRHAQGYHNLDQSFHLFDPVLTPTGHQQTEGTKKQLEQIQFDHILVSPLKRTLQTATMLFGSKKMKSVELIREHIENPCDLRESTDKLTRMFPHVDFSDLKLNDPFRFSKTSRNSCDYHHETPQEVQVRCKEAIEYLRKLSGHTIAVVCHYGFINYFMRVMGKGDNIYLDNCQYVEVELD